MIRKMAVVGFLFALCFQGEWASAALKTPISRERLAAESAAVLQFARPESMSHATRVRVFMDLNAALLEAHGDLPTTLSITDIGHTLQRAWKSEKEKSRMSPSDGGYVFDPYRSKYDPNVALETLIATIERSVMAPVRFGDFAADGGARDWLRTHDIEQGVLAGFYRQLMNLAATEEDLAIFASGYIDISRELAGQDFAPRWKGIIEPEVTEALSRHGKNLEWLMTEGYPLMLSNAARKEGWDRPSTYVYGFAETLHSYLQLATQLQRFPLLAGLNSRSNFEESAYLMLTYLGQPTGKVLARRVSAATGELVQWTLPSTLNEPALRTRLKALTRQGSSDIHPLLRTLTREIAGGSGSRPQEAGSALWNIPFQHELQRFLRVHAERAKFTPANFFTLLIWQGQQDQALKNAADYFSSLTETADFEEASYGLFSYVANSLKWVTGRGLEESPAFRAKAAFLANFHYEQFKKIYGPTSSKTAWILATVKALTSRGDKWQTSHLESFFATLLVAEPQSLRTALQDIMAGSESTAFTMMILSRYGSNAQPYIAELQKKAASPGPCAPLLK